MIAEIIRKLLAPERKFSSHLPSPERESEVFLKNNNYFCVVKNSGNFLLS